MADLPQSKSSQAAWTFPFRTKPKVRRPGPVTALDLDGRTLRVVQTVPRNGRTEVTRIAAAELELASDADHANPTVMGQAVARALDRLHLKPGMVVMGVPRNAVILRTLSLPAIEDVRELASMVHMQLGKDLPFRAEDTVIDFCCRTLVEPASRPSRVAAASTTVPETEPARLASAEKKTVLVAVVRKETVDFYGALASAAGMKLVALGLMSQANARCLDACAVASQGEAVALVSLRPDELGIDVVANGSLLFSRGTSLAGAVDPDPKDSAKATALPELAEVLTPEAANSDLSLIDAVTIEVVRTLHSYGMESTMPPSKLLVAGTTGRERAVLEALRERLNIACALLEPTEALALDPKDRELIGASTGPLGLGLGINDAEGLPFDFLSPKRPAVQRNMRRIRTLAMAGAGAVLLICLLGLRSHWVNQRLKVQRLVQADLTAAEKNRPKYRQFQQQANTLQTWSKEGRNWLEQYAYLSAVLPASEDLYVTSLSVSGQGTVHLAVQARSGEILANLDRQLRAAGYEVKPLAITPGTDKYGYNFRSTVELAVPAKMKIELAKLQVPVRPADDGSLDAKTRPARKGARP